MHSRLGSFIILAAVTAVLVAPAAASAQAPELSVSDDSVAESGGEIQFDVSRGEPTDDITYFHFEVSDGTALFPADYGPFSDSDGVNDSNLQFDEGVTTLRITVPIVNDSLFEADEDLFVDLAPGGVNGTIIDGQGRAVIVNDDGAAPPTTPPSSTTPAPGPKPKKKKCKKKGKKASAAKKCKK